MACNDQKNPLQHSGASQPGRRLPALQAAYVRADERGDPDWIVFASRFSQYINFYGADNQVINNWQPFFDSDIAAVLGSLAIQDISAYQETIRERLAFLRDDGNESNQPKLEETLGSLFSAMLTLSLALDAWRYRLPQGQALQLQLTEVISRKLQPALKALLAYYKGGRSTKKTGGGTDPALSIIANKDFPDWLILGRPVRDVLETVNTQRLSPEWLEGATDLKAFYNSMDPDRSIYGAEDAGPVKRIQHAANHNLFVSLLDRFLNAYAGVIQAAEKELTIVLASYNQHPPHYALFLTFLRLYRTAQDELNNFTQRHLDFYYQEVLRLFPKKALPHSAFILLELNKQTASLSLPKGALFRGGKDSLGQEVLYALARETVFNQAKVAQLMSVYQSKAYGRLYAAPVADSLDGMGKALKEEDPAWHPFGNKTFTAGALKSIDMPEASIGFAVASPLLYLNEGDREIQLALNLANLTGVLPPALKLDTLLTTARGWLPADNTIAFTTRSYTSSDAIILTIRLDGNAPAVANYNAKVHGGTFARALPVLKVMLRQEEGENYPYRQLKDLILSEIQLTVFVGVDSATGKATKTGLKQLLLANEFGPVDPSKPFQPFGFAPKMGSSFILGSEEYFKKKNAAFQLKLKWLDLQAASDVDFELPGASEGKLAPDVSVAALAKGAWQMLLLQAPLWTQQQLFYYYNGKINTYNADLFYNSQSLPDAPLSPADKNAGGVFVPYDAAYGAYTAGSNQGFFKITLNQGFGYDAYQKAYTKYLIDTANKVPNTQDPGAPPYVPKLESISLHYTATAESTPEDAADEGIYFYHLYPFGEAEPETKFLLPQFITGTPDSDSGELYIGLDNLQPAMAVNLLFGAQEGTADPLILKPEDHVTWSYLSRNQWLEFDARAISDGTAQLIQTGIISFAIPENATTDNTILPAGFLWLRASVKTATAAVCRLFSIDAQAASVTFADNNNAPDFLNQPLPPGRIAKLQTARTEVKKIIQPYASFGGRPAEERTAYDTRVSERLRHKDRAITIWDYERLILEAFPQLYRVKCLSHTAYEALPNGAKRFNEMAPGHVTIITLPQLSGRPLADPLRPYTSESLLAQIGDFIREHTSCHVQTHVVHPLFEEVALQAEVWLMPGYDDLTYYTTRLQEELTAFLTPWAYQQQADVSFGGRVSKSVLINFMEERPYVDYITNVRLYHRTETNPNSKNDVEEVTASSGIAVLVSVAPQYHELTLHLPESAAVQTKPCMDPQTVTEKG